MPAYCNSLKCGGHNPENYVKKDVTIHTNNCPDCGSALFWKDGDYDESFRKHFQEKEAKESKKEQELYPCSEQVEYGSISDLSYI
jgi:hypothetical protein